MASRYAEVILLNVTTYRYLREGEDRHSCTVKVPWLVRNHLALSSLPLNCQTLSTIPLPPWRIFTAGLPKCILPRRKEHSSFLTLDSYGVGGGVWAPRAGVEPG